MDAFELACPYALDAVEITFTHETVARGQPAFRGFACSNEAVCQRAKVKCALYDTEGFEAFDVAAALRHLNG